MRPGYLPAARMVVASLEILRVKSIGDMIELHRLLLCRRPIHSKINRGFELRRRFGAACHPRGSRLRRCPAIRRSLAGREAIP